MKFQYTRAVGDTSKNIPRPEVFPAEFYQIFKEELSPVLLKISL
jgi:hypothetical protein